VTTRNTRSTSPEFEIACSTPGGRKMKSCLRTTWFFPAISLADRVFALERGAVFHEGPAQPLLTDLEYRKKSLLL
jgi:hypothetical protein